MKTGLKEICDIVLAIVFIYLEVLSENNLVLQSVLILSNWNGMECEKNPSFMKMPISWWYTDICGVIIWYIADHLDPTNYLLNFGIIAINELHPKVIIRFTLKNIRNNLSKSWTQAIEGEVLENLFDCVYAAVEMHKIDVW